MENMKRYLERKIASARRELEKNYQESTDVIQMERLETEIRVLTEVLIFVNKNAPEAATSKGIKI